MFRQRKRKAASAAFGGRQSKCSTGGFDTFADDSEAHTATFDLISGLESLEHFEDEFVELRGDARAVVGDGELMKVSAILQTQFNASVVVVVMFDGVANQVHEDLLQRHARDKNGSKSGAYGYVEVSDGKHGQGVSDQVAAQQQFAGAGIGLASNARLFEQIV